VAARAQAVLRASAVIAAAFSSAAAVDYYGGGHAFCASGSGCDAVRHSALGQSIGLGLPAVGMLGFAAVALLSLSSRASIRLLAKVAALTGAAAGAVLLALQMAAVGSFCSLCVGVDLAAVVCGAAAWVMLRDREQRRDGPAGSTAARSATILSLLLALVAPIAWALWAPREVPAYIRSLGVAGKINVIELSDFECPYCRALHPVLEHALEPYADRVHFVRKPFPLPSHRHARDATRAYVCALEQDRGKAEALAGELFEAPRPDATTASRFAGILGLDTVALDACVRAPATDARIDREMERIRGSDFHGLPTVWIGERVIEGFNAEAGAAPYSAALEHAARELAQP
jgi:protein-disulfide isomerase